ncbi:phosphotransferase family protein [bacterium RCC_150]
MPSQQLTEIVEKPEEASEETLLVMRPLEDLLDRLGIGVGPIEAIRIGEGNSNPTFRLVREGGTVVLRRPPRPPFQAGAHDVLREAKIQQALAGSGIPVPRILHVCVDESLLGVPFYLMEFIDGQVLTTELPSSLNSPSGRQELVTQLVRTLADVHAVDWRGCGLSSFDRGETALARRVMRWARVWSETRSRDIADVNTARELLLSRIPPSTPRTLVHGDYRLGNVMVAPHSPVRIRAVLDWEVATIDDPLLDIGWLLACHPEPGDEDGTLTSLASGLIGPGLPTRNDVVELYQDATQRELPDLNWYIAFAYWRGAVGLESIYRQTVAGNGESTQFTRGLETGIPALAAHAMEYISKC